MKLRFQLDSDFPQGNRKSLVTDREVGLIERETSGVIPTQVSCNLHHFEAVCLWTEYLTSLSLRFLGFVVGIMMTSRQLYWVELLMR